MFFTINRWASPRIAARQAHDVAQVQDGLGRRHVGTSEDSGVGTMKIHFLNPRCSMVLEYLPT
jgi:hypothetical protein